MADRLTTFIDDLLGIGREFVYDDGMLGTILAFMLVFGGVAAALLGLVLIAGLLA